MCRIAAFPPNFPKAKALEIIENFYIGNDDGTGSVYVKDGKFVTQKYNFSFEKVLKRKLPLLDHMPYNGWTLAHVRAASHGGNTLANTHPFIKKDVAMVHNGIFNQYAPVKIALSATHKFKGQTDSEVAAVLWNVAGRDKFRKAIHSGVYMFLNRSGRVDVVGNAGGDLVFQNTKWGPVLASELPSNYNRTLTVMEGYFKLGKMGKMIHSDWKKDKYTLGSWEKWYAEDYEYADYSTRHLKKTKKKTSKKDHKTIHVSTSSLPETEVDAVMAHREEKGDMHYPDSVEYNLARSRGYLDV